MPDMPKPPIASKQPIPSPDEPVVPVIIPQPINGQPSGLTPKKKLKKIILFVGSAILAALVLIIATIIIWYNVQLSAVGSDKNQLVVVTIEHGATPGQIGSLLQSQSVIRSNIAFDIYTRLAGKRNILQAGTYRLSPAESTPDIVGHLVKGDVDQFKITFLPGATLQQDRKVLTEAGFTNAEIDAGLNAKYDSSIFADKPASADLEGYIYGETYNFNGGATVSDILKRTFSQFETVVKDNDLVTGFAKHGLNLYQGITLASIIQREASSVADRKQVAQVFHLRLQQGMALGSDVTYQYIADKTGAARDPSLDSPYNTRIKVGLPPGPISSPGLTSLLAVKDPASGDYVYFLSGDDNVTYFAHTNDEHEANVAAHCKIKCSTL